MVDAGRDRAIPPQEEPFAPEIEAGEEWNPPQEDSDWVPPEVDFTKPSVARVYDYALGGKTNFEVDRQLFEQISQVFPEYRAWARANRAFMRRAVHFMASEGVTQFVDLGAGIPTSPNVHEVARRTHPTAAVSYVDHDPVAIAHGRALLAGYKGVTVVAGDIRQPAAVLGHEEVRAAIDFDRPVGLLLVAVLHFVDQASAIAAVERYVSSLAPGSYLAISVVQLDPNDARSDDLSEVDVVAERWGTDIVLRAMPQVEELFQAVDLVEPGIVEVPLWRPTEAVGDVEFLYGLAGVGRVRRA